MKKALLVIGVVLPLSFAVFVLVSVIPEHDAMPGADRVLQTNQEAESAPERAPGQQARQTFEQAQSFLQKEQATTLPVKWHNEGADEQLVPVLCYHRIDSGKADNYFITREMFAWQMNYLATNARVIPSSMLVDYILYKQGLSTKPVTLPPRAVVIHFDDNYQSVYDTAWPILARLRLPWSFFVYKYHHKPVSDENLKRMARAGVDIQAHSMTHPWFHKPGRNQSLNDYIREMHWQVGGCKKYLEGISKRPVDQFAWPFGSYSDLSILLGRQYGFRAMFAADGGYVTSRSSISSLERILVTKGWSKTFFKEVVEGKIRFAKVFKPAWLLKNTATAKRLTQPDQKYL